MVRSLSFGFLLLSLSYLPLCCTATTLSFNPSYNIPPTEPGLPEILVSDCVGSEVEALITQAFQDALSLAKAAHDRLEILDQSPSYFGRFYTKLFADNTASVIPSIEDVASKSNY